MNRALRAATVGVLLFSPLVITACSAGQVNQTSSQQRDKVGPSVEVGDLTLRGVQLAYPTDGSYAPGEDAELQMSIVNSGTEDDALVGIKGTGFSEVRVTGSASGTVSASPSGSAAATTTSAPAQATTSGGARALDITIPAGSGVYLGENAPTVTLVSLGQELAPAQTMDLTFTFEKAGDVTIAVPVAVPASNVPQTSTFNFHESSEGDTPGTEAGGGNG
ncbi:copper chaperone PCu(A)C [Petropleomorpha daqingensis]|uniref:Copper(I)-binding protein n=1 Tax=Petropleomorpha daqingensis TaxID=2026353 RepID=A0A853CFY8_9ACTN|nr:copper chaperone PCu(A)C [Petropleomorpha daqingensis]NYJ06091.1 copper(I)-binding protein [Petropleomorpha daqingensis]